MKMRFLHLDHVMNFKKPLATAVFTAVVLNLSMLTGSYAAQGDQYYVCRLNPQGDNFLALRSCSSAKCQMLKKIPPDAFILETNARPEGRWRQVRILAGLPNQGNSKPIGWVFDKYLCRSEK